MFLFGMRCHIGVDAASGLDQAGGSTAANIHVLISTAERLHGEEQVAYGDSGYIGLEKHKEFEKSQYQFRIPMKSVAASNSAQHAGRPAAASGGDRESTAARLGGTSLSRDQTKIRFPEGLLARHQEE